MTHRQFLAWQAWLEDEWNRPSRTDYYLMRVAQRVHQTMVKNKAGVTVKDQRVEFDVGRPRAKPKKKSEAEVKRIAAEQRVKWLGIVGGKAADLVISPEDAAKLAALPPGEAARIRQEMAAQRSRK